MDEGGAGAAPTRAWTSRGLEREARATKPTGGMEAAMWRVVASRRNSLDGAGAHAKDAQVKFEIQVYKMKDDRYMIDFQRMDGGVMTCMDAAAALMKNLRLT